VEGESRREEGEAGLNRSRGKKSLLERHENECVVTGRKRVEEGKDRGGGPSLGGGRLKANVWYEARVFAEHNVSGA